MEDLIRRADAIEAISEVVTPLIPTLYGAGIKAPLDCEMALRAVPSADRPQGYWINDNGAFRCSVCGEREDEFIDGWDWEVCGASKFCPNCGARMKGAKNETQSTVELRNIAAENKRNYKLPVMLLDAFTKVWCRDRDEEDLVFRCKRCPFEHADGKCSVKIFKSEYMPDYKDFGCMGDL